MFAVIKTGGKQYRVQEDETLRVERLQGEVGSALELPEVLMVGSGERCEVGRPYVAGAKVEAEIVAQERGPKIRVVKFRRRKHYRKQMGHRQDYTQIKITRISGP